MNNEVDEIILQLKSLKLQQTELLALLGEKTKGRTAPTDSGTGAIVDREQRTFAIGDKVKIKNPNRFQANKGTITKIGATRITVQTRSGGKIQRAPKNLIVDNE